MFYAGGAVTESDRFSRESACRVFKDYVSRFDSSDPRISLKLKHTFMVAKLCDEIARSEGLSETDTDLAWLCGLLHDIGRFEQVRRWDTFRDSASIGHAELGVEVLGTVEGARMSDFCDNEEWAGIAMRAVELHSRLKLPDDLDDRTRMFCEIVRDADKVDIVRVFSESDSQSVLGLAPDEFRNGSISDAAMAGFEERRCLGPRDRQANLDGILGVICFSFEIVSPSARSALDRLGYVDDLLRSPFGLAPSFASEDTQAKWCKVSRVLGGNVGC